MRSGPERFRSGQLASVTRMRPFERVGSASRSMGMSTLVYWGIDGESCVTIWIAMGGPAGSVCCAMAGCARRPSDRTATIRDSLIDMKASPGSAGRYVKWRARETASAGAS